MSVVRHTSQERISTFFSRYCSLSQEECNKFAQSYLGCDIRQASPQGAFSYTVRGDDFVIQFRAERSPLDLDIIKHAHQMHGDWVPQVKKLDSIPGHPTVLIYSMQLLVGVNYSLLLHSSGTTSWDVVPRQKETVKDLAHFFSQAWNSRVPIDSSTVLIKRLDFRQKLQTLAESLPPRFQPLVSYCKDNLQFVFDSAIPWCLNHGDLCDTNIIIDPLTGKLSGVIDWAEGSILPFGCALWGLETVLGRFDFEKGEWVYDEQREDLEDLFWETFRSHVGSLNPAQERGITVARLTGLFFRHAFKFNGLYAVPKDDSWDLRLLDGQLLGDRQWLTACVGSSGSQGRKTFFRIPTTLGFGLKVTHTSEKIRSSWEPKFEPQTAQDIAQIANSGDPISAFDWPVISQNIRHEVLDQLGTTILIYGNDGVFAGFETEFKQSLGEGTWFALLHNSGSNALSGLYFACNLMPAWGRGKVSGTLWAFMNAKIFLHRFCFPFMASTQR
ncbi:hypothetical protein FPOAC1_008491 [Fusarium poae]|uniref:hypothetical protein n=1 Tax=Fusarium poae TaxID=36050 RepID=UPI001CE91B3C|nr:hypothetical protein FPOAC1_008491 [Fusarium poae]KAG8669103.1 hypothetical protein FPOAC1_008491 [Fusarium poae]